MIKLINWVLAATLICGVSVMTSCKEANAQKDLPLAVQHPDIPLE